MNNENLLYLIVSYLETYKNSIFSPVEIVLNGSRIANYHALHFTYFNVPVEIRVYNTQFIKIRVDSKSTEICCCISCVRDAIDNLQRIRVAYDRY
jgi:hypothetical protein